jgi:hypothetical protein
LCWPASATDAANALPALDIKSMLVDESHFIVSVRTCPKCSQAFLSVFTETVDWTDGEDPQSRTLMPLTEQDLGKLSQPGLGIERVIASLAPERWSLQMDWPKGQEQSNFYWSTGIRVGSHD